VFDCNTFLQAAAFADGPAAECVRLAESGMVALFVSRSTLAELRRVFEYPEVVAMSPSMTPEHTAPFLQRLTFRATLVRRVPHVFHFARDPKDEPYIDLAIAVKADFLVSRDKDLLSLMTARTIDAKQFRQRTRPLRVVDPVAFLGFLGRAWRRTARR
jgi:putative PIN family toxin of toxin-antitoxin system